ncbi:MAG TPA: LysR family transcriptional regulator [Rhizobium sp.]|nr:LysR family transcriptional regulator [Rhizobium sp.]
MRRRSKNAQAQKPQELSGGRIPMIALVQTLAVAEYLSFYRAALALGTSQSSVSTRIKALEDDLGIALFDRNTRGVRLTEAGRRFVDQVHVAIGILDRAIKTAGMNARSEEGELRVGVHALTAGCFLDRLLERFHDEYPGVRLHIAEGTARDAQFMVREGTLDLAFMAGAHDLPELNSRIIWHDRLMAALPAKHSLAARLNVEWRQLAEETFLVRHGGTGPQVYDLIVTRSAGKWLTPAIIRVDVGRSALLSMIAAGHGVSLFAEEGVAANTANVTFLPIIDEPETIVFSAVWSPANGNPALMTLLSLAPKISRLHPSAESQP